MLAGRVLEADRAEVRYQLHRGKQVQVPSPAKPTPQSACADMWSMPDFCHWLERRRGRGDTI